VRQFNFIFYFIFLRTKLLKKQALLYAPLKRSRGVKRLCHYVCEEREWQKACFGGYKLDRWSSSVVLLSLGLFANNCGIAGGGAGMMEALVCHPLGTRPCSSLEICRIGTDGWLSLDTIKVRMQLSRRARAPGVGYLGNTPPPCAIQIDNPSSGQSPWFPRYRKGYRQERNGDGVV
jgi:hypothetical protein